MAALKGKAHIDAKVAYVRKTAEARRFAALLNQHLAAPTSTPNWADAGDMGFIVEQLTEITEFLGVLEEVTR